MTFGFHLRVGRESEDLPDTVLEGLQIGPSSLAESSSAQVIV